MAKPTTPALIALVHLKAWILKPHTYLMIQFFSSVQDDLGRSSVIPIAESFRILNVTSSCGELPNLLCISTPVVTVMINYENSLSVACKSCG